MALLLPKWRNMSIFTLIMKIADKSNSNHKNVNNTSTLFNLHIFDISHLLKFGKTTKRIKCSFYPA